MIQERGGSGLASEPAAVVLADSPFGYYFDRHSTPEFQIDGFENGSHTALADFPHHLVMTQKALLGAVRRLYCQSWRVGRIGGLLERDAKGFVENTGALGGIK